LIFKNNQNRCNENWMVKQRDFRERKVHPSDFEEKWKKVENNLEFKELTERGRLLWGYDEYDPSPAAKTERAHQLKTAFPLHQRYIDFFKRYGYVVVPGTINQSEMDALNQRVNDHVMQSSGIDHNNLEETLTPEKWKKVAGKFGGMLNLFYFGEMDAIRDSVNLHAIQSQLLEATFDKKRADPLFTCTLEEFDWTKLWVRCDRLNFRLPDKYATITNAS